MRVLDKSEITWDIAIKVWWSFFWRVFLGGIFAGLLFYPVNYYLVSVAKNPSLAASAKAIFTFLVNIPISIVVFKLILGKPLGGFSVSIEKD